MDYNSFCESVKKLLNDLDCIDKVILLKKANDIYKFNSKEIIEYFSMTEDHFSIELPDSFKTILFSDPFELSWNYKLNNQLITGGEISIRMIDGILVDTTKTDFADRLTKYEKKIYADGFRFFDAHPHAGDGKKAAIKVENGTIVDKVWYVHTIHEEMWPMELNYSEYIEHTLHLKGLYNWQYLFIDKKLDSWGFDLSLLGKRLKDYTQLFPESDVTRYSQLYKDKGGK